MSTAAASAPDPIVWLPLLDLLLPLAAVAREDLRRQTDSQAASPPLTESPATATDPWNHWKPMRDIDAGGFEPLA